MDCSIILSNETNYWALFCIGISLKAPCGSPVLNYAGQVAVDGELYQGIGLFKFVLIKGDSNATLWSNDGSSVKGSEPVKPVHINVNGGLYSVLLETPPSKEWAHSTLDFQKAWKRETESVV